ncbi:MAG: HD domain-containing protein [Candidatus Eisenbacteria bacterium]
MATVGGVSDVILLQAALLHDTIEDTETTAEELEAEFGAEVRVLVEEVTDDMSLPRAERKRLQVERAPHLSPRARQLKIADHASNIDDLGVEAPVTWSMERRISYLAWSEQVIAGCRGVNEALEAHYDAAVRRAKSRLARPV